MKVCTKCGLEKPLTEFYSPRGRTTASGAPYFLPSCKQCFADYYQANRERQLANTHRNNIKRRYGMAVEEYDALIAQGCTICGRNDVRIIMDHCHVTNAVRAPLCDGCNIMLGGARDKPDVLRAAADYLESHAAA